MDDLCKLESTDTAQSRRVATRLQARLKASRDPALLGDIVEFYFKTFSKRARKVLTTLREAHSQDFFDKLNDSIEKTCTRLPVLKLLAHLLKSSQTNWLYRIVDHPLFTSILTHLKTSGDVVVLSNALFVVAAILPMVPSYIGHHLQDLFIIFCELATIRETNRLGLTPKELYLHLEVAVYYFFLQLYALFPCNLFQFLRSHYSHSSTAEINAFQEYIAPLFTQVQLHPSLVTDGSAYELSKAKWGSMEPQDIATLSLQLCLDTSSSSQERPALLNTTTCDGHISSKSCDLAPTPTTPILRIESSTNVTQVVSESSTPQAVPRHLQLLAVANHSASSRGTTTTTTRQSLPAAAVEKPASIQALSDLPEPAGLKSAQELDQFWSPSVTLGHIAPSRSESVSHSSGHTSLNPPSRPSLQPSNLSTPISDSTMSSAQHTPGPVYTANAFNYSPTASVDGETGAAHGRGAMTQSAIHSASFLEDSHNTSSSMDPLSQSMMAVRSSGESSSHVSPSRSLPGGRGTRGGAGGDQSLKKRLGRFIGILTQKGRGEGGEGEGPVQEGFTEIFVSDLERKATEGSTTRKEVGVSGGHGILKREEIGEECFATSPPVNSHCDQTATTVTSRPVQVEEEVKSKRDSNQDEEILKISNLPISTRTTRTNSESSHDSRADFRIEGTGDHHDVAHPLQPALLVGSYQHDGPSDTSLSRYSASYPERSPTLKRSRSRNSKSETNATQTVLMVQERLQKLVEASESSGARTGGSKRASTTEDEGGEKVASSRDEETLVSERPKLGTFMSIDSNKTVKVPSPTDEQKGGLSTASGGVLQPSHSATSLVGSRPGASDSVASGSRLFIRRVSVCSPRHPDQQTQQQQTVERDSSSENVFQAPPRPHPSPVVLLDQFVARGEILHRGHFESIPLTELEGVDWNHFGGCPHSEEFGMMRSQVALLHSQLLFERHQCLQHARRNRRLLSRARMATQVTEELLSLRDQLHQQNLLIASLQTQLQRSTNKYGLSKTENKLRSENKTLGTENSQLKDSNHRLSEEVHRLKQQNAQLSEELKHTNEKVFSLENEMTHLQPRLKRGEQLQSEVDSLSRELQVLGELYHQQKEDAMEAAGQRKREREWRAMCKALQREKEAGEKRANSLYRELAVSQARVREMERGLEKKGEEIEALQGKLRTVQGQYKAKMKALGDKYFSVKLVGQQLETHIMELRGQSTQNLKKKVNTSRHRRSSSHPTGHHRMVTPSPPSQLTH